MLVKNDSGFLLYPWKVRYIQDGQEIEQWALPSKEWWTEFAQNWENTEIIEFIEAELTEEQLARFEDLNQLNIPEGHRNVCIEYIMTGIFPEGIDHPLRLLQIQKENQALGIEISEREIENIELGQQLSNLEIQLLELQQ